MVPTDEDNVEVEAGGRTVRLTNLSKPFWPKLGITKRDLIQYYADVADVLLPHIHDRAMVMKRYPHGAEGAVLLHEAHAEAASRLAQRSASSSTRPET